MPPYTGSSKESPSFYTRFIRVEEEMFIPDPPDVNTDHLGLARQDELLEKIGRLRFETPEAIDAGFINLVNADNAQEITIIGYSLSLDIPVMHVGEIARERTRRLIEKLNPEFLVISSL